MSPGPQSFGDAILEELIDLHSSSPTFRYAFKSKSMSGSFIALAKSFIVQNTAQQRIVIRANTARIADKLCHLAMMMTLEGALEPSQRHEVRFQGVIDLPDPHTYQCCVGP